MMRVMALAGLRRRAAFASPTERILCGYCVHHLQMTTSFRSVRPWPQLVVGYASEARQDAATAHAVRLRRRVPAVVTPHRARPNGWRQGEEGVEKKVDEVSEESKLQTKIRTEEEVLAALVAARTSPPMEGVLTNGASGERTVEKTETGGVEMTPMPTVNGQSKPRRTVIAAVDGQVVTSTPNPVKKTTPIRASETAAVSKTTMSVVATNQSTEIAMPVTDPAKLEKIAGTLQRIEVLQNSLPSVDEVGAMISQLRGDSFSKGQTLFDRYRIYGNPFLDEKFLTPGVLACCEAEEPEKGLAIVRDMLNQGRKVDETTLRALLDTCDTTGAAKEAIELWDLMERAGVKLVLADFDRLLSICHRREYVDGAVKVLKVLRLHRRVNVPTYIHWLRQASIVWRVDAFFDLLMEMRLAGVELEIPSLTSLQSGRMDSALTVMEGVRAVGLDPCYAMSAVYASMAAQLHRWDNSGISASASARARRRFGDLKPTAIDWPVRPIPQVLETQAAGLILEEETFKRLKYKQVQDIDMLLQWLPITANITINLRKQLQRMSLLVNTHRVKQEIPSIAAEYKQGKTLIELSSAHNYPPVSLMRLILRQRGLNSLEIRHALASPTEHLTKRDQIELRRAAEYDSIHHGDPFIGAPTYNSDSLETTVGHFVGSYGIRYKTERELGDEQVKKFGRRVLSPDILLLDPVLINGTPIRWIDAKNYYGAHIVSKRLISRQVSAYVKEWGPGAIVFGMGFSDMFELPGVMCLDATPFPKTRAEKAKVRTKAMFYSAVHAFSWKKDLGSELRARPPSLMDKPSTPRTTSERADSNHPADFEDTAMEDDIVEDLLDSPEPTAPRSSTRE